LLIRLNNISKQYGEIKAVDSVSMEIREGEMLGFVGPNGSGKSTLLKIILGIIKPSSGQVVINGEELSEKGWKQFRGRIGYMPERVSFYDNLSGRETLRLFARIKGGNMEGMMDIISRILPDDVLRRKVGGYSKGMRQRLNLAQAILNDPDLLILDEPTSGLDPGGTKEFFDILDGIKRRKKLTVILSSHVLAEVEDKTDRVAVLKNGTLKALGSLEELYTGLKLPLIVSIAIKGKDKVLEELLMREGADYIVYKDGHLIAHVKKENKLQILSTVIGERERFKDLSLREPSLEEVFFGVH
jgi:Cu-processing system ATP-binding protein